MQRNLPCRKTCLLFLGLFVSTTILLSQPASIEGIVTDAKTGETLVGASILIQGTTTGTITDFDGKYSLKEIKPGTYNLVISYISYDQQIKQLSLQKGQTLVLNFSLEQATLNIESVKVTAQRRTDTELSLITSIKATKVAANGISSQQIGKSQDKDASEVIRRVPGITVVDDRFVIIRGLSERYNSVLLNNSLAPSSESDVKAFSFDLIPSNMIDNMIIYKAPSPDLPADFAGGCVQIFTRNNAEENKFSVSTGTSWNESITNKDFYMYQGSTTDRLGYDNGFRSIPKNFPGTEAFNQLKATSGKTADQIASDRETITNLGRSFSRVWTASEPVKALPDQKLALYLSRRFVAGPVSVGSINTLSYSNSKDYEERTRVEYPSYSGTVDTSFSLLNHQYSQSVKIGAISNWSFIFGKNQKIEFRNLFNQIGGSTFNSITGKRQSEGYEVKSQELLYKSRSIYSGQLGGQFAFLQDRTRLDFTLGYSYANQNQPDDRRISYLKNADSPELGFYLATSNGTVSPENLGRVYLYNEEKIQTASANILQKFSFFGMNPELKIGLYREKKDRQFTARNLGFIEASAQFDWNLRFIPLDSLFTDPHISYPKGIKIADGTSSSDSYHAQNDLLAAYLKLDIPVTSFFDLNGGLRIEKNRQLLYSGTQTTAASKIDTLNFFPSVNAVFFFNKKWMIRLGYGLTVNRPEFRETAPYSYYDFEEKESSYGNIALTNAYIKNYDFRLEWYPNNYDMITLAAFYKDFSHPIEKYLFPAGSNRNFKFGNVESATSRGLEIDIRKSLINLEGNSWISEFISHYTIMFNGALIDSRTVSDLAQAREKVRPMLGQSPYIINAGIFYQTDSSGWMVSLLYNRIGKRIVYVGDKDIPHIWELPRNSLDFTITKKIGEYFALKAGIVDILANPVRFASYLDVSVPSQNGGTTTKTIEMITKTYTPGRLYNLSLTYTF